MTKPSGYKVVRTSDVKALEVEEAGAEKARLKWLISEEDGAPNFFMRLFEVDPGGRTPLHSHPWEHEIFILNGKARIILGDEEVDVEPETAVYIPPNLRHSITNPGKELLRFLCLIPRK
ncbi:MAG: cupin domain-containing protein [Thaumarchaeota archaeon]|nr:cupin domain-containing protein [Nitrososphaerota archaeon]